MGAWAFLLFVLVEELPQADIEEEEAEQLPQDAGVQTVGKPGGQGRGDQPRKNGGEDSFFLQQSVFMVGRQGGGGGREEVQEVDALGLMLADPG